MVSEKIDEQKLPGFLIEPRLFIMHLLAGIALPIFSWTVMYLLSLSSWIKYRPWVGGPLGFTLYMSAIAAMLVYSIYFCRKYGLFPLFRFRPSRKLLKDVIHCVPLLLILGCVLWLVRTLIRVIFEAEVQTPQSWAWVTYAPNSILLLSFLILGFTIIPIVEEVYFRGFIYKALKIRAHVWIALVVQALVFTAIHCYAPAYAFQVFLIGIAFAIVYDKKKSLLTPALTHCIINGIHFAPFLVLWATNLHIPAKNWSEAGVCPHWLDLSTYEHIERQKDGMEQWQYAIDTWGSTGSRQWKDEVKAFEAVCYWFPEERVACAKARVGIVYIYSQYLRDYRRAVVQADRILREYSDQREPCAVALAEMGWSYYMLRDFDNARKAFNRVVAGYQEHDEVIRSAVRGIEWLNAVEGKQANAQQDMSLVTDLSE
ncbi:MAG: CPBP family glutamic-type intramembrane protease [Planctomycetota bacterium]|jgi:membrane protease YdiL (CAAX protease family)